MKENKVLAIVLLGLTVCFIGLSAIIQFDLINILPIKVDKLINLITNLDGDIKNYIVNVLIGLGGSSFIGFITSIITYFSNTNNERSKLLGELVGDLTIVRNSLESYKSIKGEYKTMHMSCLVYQTQNKIIDSYDEILRRCDNLINVTFKISQYSNKKQNKKLDEINDYLIELYKQINFLKYGMKFPQNDEHLKLIIDGQKENIISNDFVNKTDNCIEKIIYVYNVKFKKIK